jgi:hypothetical protein
VHSGFPIIFCNLLYFLACKILAASIYIWGPLASATTRGYALPGTNLICLEIIARERHVVARRRYDLPNNVLSSFSDSFLLTYFNFIFPFFISCLCLPLEWFQKATVSSYVCGMSNLSGGSRHDVNKGISFILFIYWLADRCLQPCCKQCFLLSETFLYRLPLVPVCGLPLKSLADLLVLYVKN